jgi:hypothetical protein
MTTPITIIRLRAYEGPNIHAPQPGVLLQLNAPSNQARRLRDVIRDGAQAVGIVIASLEVASHALGDGFLIEASFSTDQPGVGADTCRYIVDGMRAEAAGDSDWDRDGPLYQIQTRRRREALPVPALQLIAEARQRDLPTMALPDGRIQLGYGARSWQYDPRSGETPAPPWARIGSIAITLVTGHTLRAAAVERRAAEITAAGFSVHAADGMDFDATRALLANPAVDAAVIGLDSDSLLSHGLPVDRCDLALICDMGGPRPAAAADDEEWLRALGLPMLVSPNPAQINLADLRLYPLIPHAPNGVLSSAG